MKKLYQNKEWLEEQFRTVKYAQVIGKSVGVTGDTIEYWRKKFDIPKHPERKYHRRRKNVDHDFFESIDTESKAYWLGFLVADGCLLSSAKGGKANRIEFNLKMEDWDHLEKFKKDIKSDHEIKPIEKNNKKRGFISTVCNLRINSTKLCRDLENLGVQKRKTGNEVMPDLPEDMVRHFVRGYFDGDGSITGDHNYSIKLCCSSKRLIDQIVELINSELGIDLNPQDYSEDGKEFYIIESRNQTNNPKILRYMYKDATVYLDRKYERAMELCSPLQ